MDVRHDRFEHVDFGIVAFGREVAPLPRAHVDDLRVVRHGKRCQPHQRQLGEPFLPLLVGEIEPVRRQRLVDRPAAGMFHRFAPGIVIIRDLLEAFEGCVLALRLDHDRRIAEIIEQRIHPLLEQRQPVFHAGIAAALADGLVKLVVALRRAEFRDIAHPETPDGLGDQLEFRHRHQIEGAHVESRALGFGIEGADRFQRVAEEVEAHRLIEPGREQIEDTAAHGIFAGLAHRRRPIVAVVLQPGDDGIHRHHLPRRDRQRLRRDHSARGHALHGGVDGGQHDQRLFTADQPRQPCQRGQPLRQDAAMRGDPVIGLAVPGGKLHHRQIGREERKRARQLLHARAVATDHGNADRRPLRPGGDRAGEIGDDQTFGTFRDIGKRQRPPLGEQFGGRTNRRLHARSSAGRKSRIRANRGPDECGASGLSPVNAA